MPLRVLLLPVFTDIIGFITLLLLLRALPESVPYLLRFAVLFAAVFLACIREVRNLRTFNMRRFIVENFRCPNCGRHFSYCDARSRLGRMKSHSFRADCRFCGKPWVLKPAFFTRYVNVEAPKN